MTDIPKPEAGAEDRLRRIARSQELVTRIVSAPRSEGLGRGRANSGPDFEGLSDRNVAELQARVALLRRLGDPRTELPPRIAAIKLMRIGGVQKFILRAWNFFSRPSRTQAFIMADCLQIITHHLQKDVFRDDDR